MPLSSSLAYVVRDHPFGAWIVTVPIPTETNLGPAVAAHIGLPTADDIPPAFRGLRALPALAYGATKGLVEPVVVADSRSDPMRHEHDALIIPWAPPGHIMVDVLGFNDKRHAVRFALRARRCLDADFAYASHVVTHAGASCSLADFQREIPRLRRAEFQVLTAPEEEWLEKVAPGQGLPREPDSSPRPPAGLCWDEALRTGQASRAEYRATPDWRKMRNDRWRLDAGRCCRCGAAARGSGQVFDCHHVDDTRYGAELLDDLRIVCRFCHDDIHGIDGQSRPPNWPTPAGAGNEWVALTRRSPH
jgi:hypothetical protein